MSRPKTEINPIPGQRLKMIIDEQGISQSELSREIHLSQQTISRMINGQASVTDQTASQITDLYPQYRKPWLMGYDDMKTGSDSLSAFFQKSKDEGSQLMQGLISLAALNDFQISFTSPCDLHTGQIEDALKCVKDGYTISRDGRSAQISLDEMNALQNEICDFVEFKLQRIIEKQNQITLTRSWKLKDGHLCDET